MHRGRLMHLVFLRERPLVWPNICTKPPDLTSLAWVRWPLCSDFWQLIGLVFTQQWSHRLYSSLNSENIQTQWDRIQLDWDQNSFLEGLFWQGDLLPPYHTSWLCTHIYKVVLKHKIVIWVWDTVLLHCSKNKDGSITFPEEVLWNRYGCILHRLLVWSLWVQSLLDLFHFDMSSFNVKNMSTSDIAILMFKESVIF